jgi:hypothetical protein
MNFLPRLASKYDLPDLYLMSSKVSPALTFFPGCSILKPLLIFECQQWDIGPLLLASNVANIVFLVGHIAILNKQCYFRKQSILETKKQLVVCAVCPFFCLFFCLYEYIFTHSYISIQIYSHLSGELVPEPPWAPKSKDDQIAYVKWCVVFVYNVHTSSCML